MPKIGFQESIEVRVNTTTLFESESSPDAKLRPTELKRLPNRPTTITDTLPLVPGMMRSPDGDITISGSVNIMQPVDPVLATFVGDYQRRFWVDFVVLF
jgi:hypothetical protein